MTAFQSITLGDLVELSTPETDDVLRLADCYGRAGTTKP